MFEWMADMIGINAKLKTVVIWVVSALFSASLITIYALYSANNDLRQAHSRLEALVDQQAANNQQLVNSIEALQRDKKHAQDALDEANKREKQAQVDLERQTQRLEQELSDESCSDEPIDYPADWVPEYQNRHSA